MSWNITLIGERAAVKAAVEANTNLPSALKALITATIHDVVPHHGKDTNGIRVVGYGHHNDGDGSSLGNIGKLEIEPFILTLPAPVVIQAPEMPEITDGPTNPLS